MLLFSPTKLSIKPTFSAYSAAPEICFKYMQVTLTRQVPVSLLGDTDFYIICVGDAVKAVMIVDQ